MFKGLYVSLGSHRFGTLEGNLAYVSVMDPGFGSHRFSHGGRGFGGRGQRGRGADDRGQIQQGQGHARVFALTQQDAQASNTVVSSIFLV